MAKVSYLHSSRSATAARYKFLDRLVREYDTDLKRFLLGILRNQEDVNDVAQDAYLKLYRLSKPEQIKYPKALLFRAASNLAIDRLNKRAHPSNSTELELDALPDDKPGLERVVASQEAFDYLLKIIDELPQRRRQVLVMKRFSQLTHQQISKKLGITKSMVEQHMTRALKHCRSRLRELGMD